MKTWQNLNIWEWHWLIRTANKKKLWGTFGKRLLPFGERLLPSGAKVLYFCLLYKSVESKLYKTVHCLICMGVKLCLAHEWENVAWGVLRKVFGPKREDTHDGRENCTVSCRSADVVRVRKWRRMRWARYVLRKGEDLQTWLWLENMKKLGGL